MYKKDDVTNIYLPGDMHIFDDSFSALDYKTDFILRKELKKHDGV